MSKAPESLYGRWGGGTFGSPEAIKRNAFLQYFREVGAEYAVQAQRLETRLLAGNAAQGHPVKRITDPSSELDDVCCLTQVTRNELQEVLPQMFDAYRRLKLAAFALTRARRVSPSRRLELAAGGLDCVMDGVGIDTEVRTNIEAGIDDTLHGMFRPCTWSQAKHHGRPCQKPVPWSKVDMGGGNSGL